MTGFTNNYIVSYAYLKKEYFDIAEKRINYIVNK